MKRWLGSLLVLLLCFAPQGLAAAHELQTDGTIGAILHTEPDDDVVSGKPTQYMLEFDDTTHRFSLPKCNCSVSVRSGSKTIVTSTLSDRQNAESTGSVTFPKPGAYTFEVTGQPKDEGTFQPFKLSYNIQVASDAAKASKMPTLLWVGLGGGIGLVLLAAYATTRASNRPNGDHK